LCFAVSEGYKELSDILSSKGAIRTEAMDTAELFAAVKRGDITRVESLIKKNSDIVNSIDSKRETPLHVAAREGHEAVVTLLISRGADVNAINEYGRSALHLAAINKKLKTVEALIAAGADANNKDRNGDKPLAFATFSGEDIANLLRRYQTWE